MPQSSPPLDPVALATAVKGWALELGFDGVAIADVDLSAEEPRLLAWLRRQFQGEMHYMGRHGLKRARPAQLVPGTLRVVCVRMNYLPEGMAADVDADDSGAARIARYALGRDYHKTLRQRLQRLAERIQAVAGPFGYRAFSDSAPVLEKPLARNAGLGWVGKNTLLLNRHAGSYFFLGELFTDLPLPADPPEAGEHCGSCRACLTACPTQAIVGPYQLDARRCISYLTIEHPGAIPEALRPAMGNRIFGCDDCQTACPWNKFAQHSAIPDFQPRHGLDRAALVELFGWDEAEFLRRTEGSPIRRLGHERWLRNIAVALGNEPPSPQVLAALEARREHPSALVREHVEWALARLNPRPAPVS